MAVSKNEVHPQLAIFILKICENHDNLGIWAKGPILGRSEMFGLYLNDSQCISHPPTSLFHYASCHSHFILESTSAPLSAANGHDVFSDFSAGFGFFNPKKTQETGLNSE